MTGNISAASKAMSSVFGGSSKAAPPPVQRSEGKRQMGCDIHIVVERRVGGKWIGVNPMPSITTRKIKKDDLGFAMPLATDRNYDRFARLASVRGEGEKPRGLPPDISDLTRLEVAGWGGDGHSHSWLSLKDAARIWLETEWLRDKTFDPDSYEAKYPEAHYFGCEAVDAGGSERYGKIDDYRVVFWFDN